MSEGEEKKDKRIDLSVSQVAGGGLATLTAAVAASYLGVYGTVIGAAVMSVISTAGAAVIQQFFRESGDKAKGLAERAKRQTDRQHRVSDTAREAPRHGSATSADGMPSGTRGEEAATVRTGTEHSGLLRSAQGGTPEADGPGEQAPGGGLSWWRRWKRLLVPAAVVFCLVMLTILAFELSTGRSLTDTVHGRDTRSAPTLTGGYSESGEQPAEEPAPGPAPGEQEGDAPGREEPEPEQPGVQPGQPEEEPAPEGRQDGQPEEPAPEGRQDQQDGQPEEPAEQDGGGQDGSEQKDTGGGAAPPGGQRDDTPPST